MRSVGLRRVAPALGAILLVGWLLTGVAPAQQSGKKQPPPQKGKVHTVEIKNNGFPDTITIKKGDSIVWVNKDSSTHTATEGAPPAQGAKAKIKQQKSKMFTTGNIRPGASSKAIRFDRGPGTIPYYCEKHWEMTGKVVIEP